MLEVHMIVEVNSLRDQEFVARPRCVNGPLAGSQTPSSPPIPPAEVGSRNKTNAGNGEHIHQIK